MYKISISSIVKNIKFVLLIILASINISCSEASESALNQTIEKYEKLYFECKNGKTKNDFICFKVYNTLASLYYAEEFKEFKIIADRFNSTHPVFYDSMYFVDYEATKLPKFDKTIKIYKEIFDKWEKDKVPLKNYKGYLHALYFSESYKDVLPLFDKILLNRLNGSDKETFEFMRYDSYLMIGEYDTAEVLLRKFIKTCKNSEYLKFSKLTLDSLGNIKKYSKPKN